MKRTLFSLVLFCCAFGVRMNAQITYTNFGGLLQNFDSLQRVGYQNQLDSLQKLFTTDSLRLHSPLDSLSAAIAGQNPVQFSIADSTITAARDSFLRSLTRNDLDSLNRDTLVGEYDRLAEVWKLNFDSLSGAFPNYQDTVSLFPQPPSNFFTQGANLDKGLDSVQLNLFNAGLANEPLDKRKLEKALHDLFNPALFTSIEMFGGTQQSDVTYYSTKYKVVNAYVAGIRTVEQFDRTWEPRWRGQISWTPGRVDVAPGDAGAAPSGHKFNPFLLRGEFTTMYNRQIGTYGGNTSIRLLTGLGIEAEAYAPAHRDPSIAASMSNLGYTTGCGPQLLAGFSVKASPITAYTLGTMAFGEVIGASNYNYFSNRVEAGVKYDDKMTIRYEAGFGNRARQNDKRAQYHQVTVGVSIRTLFH